MHVQHSCSGLCSKRLQCSRHCSRRMQRSVGSQTSCGSAERPATAWQLKDVQCWLKQQHLQCSKNKKEMLGCMCMCVLVCLSLCVTVIRRGGRRKQEGGRRLRKDMLDPCYVWGSHIASSTEMDPCSKASYCLVQKWSCVVKHWPALFEGDCLSVPM